MSYTAWSVVFGEQPTAAKWNQLGSNDAGLKDGTSIDDGAILQRHLGSGIPVKVSSYRTGAVATGTTTMPFDDTIPQISEGDEYMTLSHTPLKTTNRLVIIVSAFHSHSAANAQSGVALFMNATANALAVAEIYENTATAVNMVTLIHEMQAGTTSAITFRVRIGSQNAGTTTFNGQSGGRKYGGVAASGILILEYGA